MDRIEIGDVFVEQDRREHGRQLKVLAVFMPETYLLSQGYVACTSRGRVTILSYDRLADSSRFVRMPRQQPEQLSFVEGVR